MRLERLGVIGLGRNLEVLCLGSQQTNSGMEIYMKKSHREVI